MSDDDRAVELLAQLVERVEEHHELLHRMMTLIEGHVARLERLEYHVLGISPLPAMTTARRDH